MTLIYNELKLILKRKKLTQAQLSERLTVYTSYQSINQAMRNQSIKLEGWFEIADALDMALVFKLVEKGYEDTAKPMMVAEPETMYEQKVEAVELRKRNRELTDLVKILQESNTDKQIIIDMLKKNHPVHKS